MDRIHDAIKILQEVSDARMAEFVLLATVKKSTETETLNDENDEQQDAGLVEATCLKPFVFASKLLRKVKDKMLRNQELLADVCSLVEEGCPFFLLQPETRIRNFEYLDIPPRQQKLLQKFFFHRKEFL
jgi:hypothetical protein